MISSQIRQEARVALAGKWGKAALFTLCYGLVTYAFSWIAALIPFIGNIAYFIISVPISYGVLVTFIKLRRGEEISYLDFLTTGFSVFGKLWGIIGHVVLKLIVPIIILIISIFLVAFGTTGGITASIFSTTSTTVTFSAIAIIGLIAYIVSLIYLIVKGLLYSFTSYILFDNPDMSSKEIVEKSETLMNGNRGAYLCLGLSFIGWLILSAFTLYIGLLWLLPYIMISFIIFYEDRSATFSSSKETSEPEVIKENN